MFVINHFLFALQHVNR